MDSALEGETALLIACGESSGCKTALLDGVSPPSPSHAAGVVVATPRVGDGLMIHLVRRLFSGIVSSAAQDGLSTHSVQSYGVSMTAFLIAQRPTN